MVSKDAYVCIGKHPFLVVIKNGKKVILEVLWANSNIRYVLNSEGDYLVVETPLIRIKLISNTVINAFLNILSNTFVSGKCLTFDVELLKGVI